MRSLSQVRESQPTWGRRQITPPPQRDLSRVTGHHRVNTLELFKYGNGEKGKIVQFGPGNIAGGLTDARPNRRTADALLMEYSDVPGQQQMLLVAADGRGKSNGARVLSNKFVSVMGQDFAGQGFDLRQSARHANEELWRMKNDPRYHLDYFDGTMAVAALINRQTNRLQVMHLGDSRAYLCREGELWMLTRDHNNLAGYLNFLAKSAPGVQSQTFLDLKQLLSNPENMAQAYLQRRLPFRTRLSELVHDISLEYLRDKEYQREVDSLGFPEPRFSAISHGLKNGDLVLLVTDGTLQCAYRQLLATIAANRTKSPYQLSDAILLMLSRNHHLWDDATICVYRHLVA